jgi:hypothetical protein
MSEKNICPYLKKKCIEHDCVMYTHVTMQFDPQTGAGKDCWTCAIALVPVLLIENARQNRQVAHEVGRATHEITQRQDKLNDLARGSQKLTVPDMKAIEGG